MKLAAIVTMKIYIKHVKELLVQDIKNVYALLFEYYN